MPGQLLSEYLWNVFFVTLFFRVASKILQSALCTSSKWLFSFREGFGSGIQLYMTAKIDWKFIWVWMCGGEKNKKNGIKEKNGFQLFTHVRFDRLVNWIEFLMWKFSETHCEARWKINLKLQVEMFDEYYMRWKLINFLRWKAVNYWW